MKRILLTLCLCLSLLVPFAAVTHAAEPSTEATQAADEVQVTEEEGFFLLLYERLGAHLPEVFSALSLLSACIIGLCYKKGLLPLLREGLGAISAATKDCEKSATKQTEQALKIYENANNTIHFANDLAKKTEQALAEIETKLDAFGDQKGEIEKLHLLMEGQVDMLRDIFLSSALPQFEKDRVFGRVEEMKATLHRGREDESNETE